MHDMRDTTADQPLCPRCRQAAIALPPHDRLERPEGLPPGWGLWPKGPGPIDFACPSCRYLFSAQAAYDEAF
jgi:hypothetical protein